MNLLLEVQEYVRNLGDEVIARQSQRFFKTGKGEYGEGDVFLGISVPVLRQLARKYRHLSIQESEQLLKSPFHEERLLALFILVNHFKKASVEAQHKIYDLYLKNTTYINNWDLVDSSAEHIVGAYLYSKEKKTLYDLARSKDLWERRIAILSTFHYIKKNEFNEAIKISEIMVFDAEDLIHKAVGWMLREIAKRDITIAERFLMRYYRNMPRTMLRYAIEKFPEDRRQMYLKGEI